MAFKIMAVSVAVFAVLAEYVAGQGAPVTNGPPPLGAPPVVPAPMPQGAPPPHPQVAHVPVPQPFPAAWLPGTASAGQAVYMPLSAAPPATNSPSPLPHAGVGSTGLGGGQAGLQNMFNAMDHASPMKQPAAGRGGGGKTSSAGSRRHQVERYSSRIRTVQDASAASLVSTAMIQQLLE